MAVVLIVHEDGRTETVTERQVAILREHGWKPASEVPAKAPATRSRKSSAPTAEPVGDADSTAPEATPEPEEQVQ